MIEFPKRHEYPEAFAEMDRTKEKLAAAGLDLHVGDWIRVSGAFGAATGLVVSITDADVVIRLDDGRQVAVPSNILTPAKEITD